MLIVDKASKCNKCQGSIVWKEKDGKNMPFNVIAVGNGQYAVQEKIHFETCPVMVRERAQRNCPWCQMEKGVDILSLTKEQAERDACRHHALKTVGLLNGVHVEYKTSFLLDMRRNARRKRTQLEKTMSRAEGVDRMESFTEHLTSK